MECKHFRVKIKRHKKSIECYLYCLDCDATWSNSTRSMNALRKICRGGYLGLKKFNQLKE